MRISQQNVSNVGNFNVCLVDAVVAACEICRMITSRILIALHLDTTGLGHTALAMLAGRLKPAYATTGTAGRATATGITGPLSWRWQGIKPSRKRAA